MKRELRYNKDIVFHIYFLILSFHYRKIPSVRRDLFVVWQGKESSPVRLKKSIYFINKRE